MRNEIAELLTRFQNQSNLTKVKMAEILRIERAHLTRLMFGQKKANAIDKSKLREFFGNVECLK
jgi:plasmid maintenance system antidote protein VapI